MLTHLPTVPIAQFLTKAVVAGAVHDLTLNVGGTFAAEKVWLSR